MSLLYKENDWMRQYLPRGARKQGALLDSLYETWGLSLG